MLRPSIHVLSDAQSYISLYWHGRQAFFPRIWLAEAIGFLNLIEIGERHYIDKRYTELEDPFFIYHCAFLSEQENFTKIEEAASLGFPEAIFYQASAAEAGMAFNKLSKLEIDRLFLEAAKLSHAKAMWIVFYRHVFGNCYGGLSHREAAQLISKSAALGYPLAVEYVKSNTIHYQIL